LTKEESKHLLETGNPERSVLYSEGKVEKEQKTASMGRIMSYYNPKWLAVIGIFVSILNAFSFPLYGLIFAKILFIMMVPDAPNFDS